MAKLRLLKDCPSEHDSLLRQASKFTEEDVGKLQRASTILGRCHELVNLMEHFYTFSSVGNQIETVNDTIASIVDQS